MIVSLSWVRDTVANAGLSLLTGVGAIGKGLGVAGSRTVTAIARCSRMIVAGGWRAALAELLETLATVPGLATKLMSGLVEVLGGSSLFGVSWVLLSVIRSLINALHARGYVTKMWAGDAIRRLNGGIAANRAIFILWAAVNLGIFALAYGLPLTGSLGTACVAKTTAALVKFKAIITTIPALGKYIAPFFESPVVDPIMVRNNDSMAQNHAERAVQNSVINMANSNGDP